MRSALNTLTRLHGWRILVALLLVAVVLLAAMLLPIGDWLLQFVAWVRDQGPWGILAVALIYIPVAVLMVPSTLLTLGAGFALGLWQGVVAVSIGGTFGAAAAFLVGRTIGRNWVEHTLAHQPRFRSIDTAVARDGFKIILLLRLSPVFPYNVMNYALGLSQISFRDYFLASWIGMLPATIFYVYIGTAAKNLTSLATGQAEAAPGQSLLFGLGLVTAGIATFIVTRIAHRALKADLPIVQAEDDQALEINQHI